MKKFVFVLALSMVVSGLSMASEPEITLPGPGGSPMGIDRTVLWLDTPDCLAAIASSEVIGAFALESEIANDFMLEEAATIEKVTWWGGYWNYYDHTQFPTGSGFNLRYYYDAGCLPEVTPFLEFLLPGDDCCETLTDCPEDDDHIFVYEYCHSLPLEPGLYWFRSARARSGVSTSLIRSGRLRLPCLAISMTPRRCLRTSAFRPRRRMPAGVPSRGSIGRLRLRG